MARDLRMSTSALGDRHDLSGRDHAVNIARRPND
jgi:hypothetical protein